MNKIKSLNTQAKAWNFNLCLKHFLYTDNMTDYVITT